MSQLVPPAVDGWDSALAAAPRPAVARAAARTTDPPALLGALFPTASAASLRTMGDAATVVRYTQGARLWDEGERPASFLVLTRGFVRVSRVHASGNEHTLGVFGPRECIGLIAFADDRPYPGAAFAMSDDVTLIAVPGRVARAVMDADAGLCRALLGRMAGNARQLMAKISLVSQGAAAERVAALLLHMADRFGDETGEGTLWIPVRLTRRTVGELVDARVETVIRLMSQWQRDGWIHASTDGIEIIDVARLRQLAEGGGG